MAESLREALRPPGPVKFEVRELRLAGVITLAVAGELDLLTAPKLAARVGGLMRREPGDVVVDLAETQFIDSPDSRCCSTSSAGSSDADDT